MLTGKTADMAKKVGKTPKRAARRAADPRAGSSEIIDRLWGVVMERRAADPSISHSARLLARGTPKVAQKFGEEAVECIIEAVAGNQAALVAESADVLYHLLVLWVSADVHPSLVWAELERREGVSGLAEKAARRVLAKTAPTRKIP
jgi:phosphoribosyl-ATP pyrophosphohydrolase